MNGTSPFGGTCYFASGTYGVLGTPAAANSPSGRLGAARWTDSNGNIWVFGGLGWANSSGYLGDLNDLWAYQPVAPGPKPSFELIALPNPINLGGTAGTPDARTGLPTFSANGTATVTVVAADGFDSIVTLTTKTISDTQGFSITGSFSPATVIGSGTSTLTISVTGALVIDNPLGITITATSGGVSQTIWVIFSVTQTGQIKAPVFSVPAGRYTKPQTVAISSFDDNAFIYYTLDGTTPTESSPVYVNPIVITSSTTLKAIILDVDYRQSAVTTATYTILPESRRSILFGRTGSKHSPAHN